MSYKPTTWNGYLAQPCFVQIVEKQYNTRLCFIPLDELSRLYAIWDDGARMGAYCEATKDAEGS